MTFRTVPSDHDQPLRVVVAGAGAMGRAWLSVIAANPDVRLVGLADLDVALARGVADDLAGPEMSVGVDAVQLARELGAQALVNVTAPEAHHPITMAALAAGLPVLGEKPAAANLAQALALAAAAEVSGELFMVSQSRRWNPQLFALRQLVASLGAVGTVSTQFARAPRFGGFREQMAHPLLTDMAIHTFDSVRFLLGQEPLSVYCEAYNPPWSWFRHPACATAVFTMDGGARHVYTGSWCASGAETSWNGSWRVSAERGTALWDGDTPPTAHTAADAVTGAGAVVPSQREGIGRALAEFLTALRVGSAPMGEIHENALSLAMVEAAVASAESGRPVAIDEVLTQAHARAMADEPRDDVRAALGRWPSVREALAGCRYG